MTSYIKKLPAVFQTVTEKKFFDATFDQVFSKKDSDQLFGYLGRCVPGKYNPVNDFYVPEPSKDRTWWQLEATAFARNADSTKSNIFFYDDLLNRINYYGGNTLNQDRLFESEYYSWAPPIDFDMFVNYQNYYWIDQGLVTINITGVMYDDIIDPITGNGLPYFNTDMVPGALPANLTLTTGLSIKLVNDPAHQGDLTVENFGGTHGIQLVQQRPDYTSGTIFEFLPWDGTIQLSNGRIIRDTNWDTQTWDVEAQPSTGDYITMERGCIDQNAWSRTNKWFNIEAINLTMGVTNTPFPSNATRALRPIIQFSADLMLYNSGTQFKDDITFGFRGDIFGQPLLLSTYQNQPRAVIDNELNIELQTGQVVVFMEDSLSKQSILTVSINADDIVTFVVTGSPSIAGDIVFATNTAPFTGVKRGETWYYDVNTWVAAANDKVATNQPPLFQLYDHNDIPLDDQVTYPLSTFAGSKIFSYKINTSTGAFVDPVLNMALVYTSLGQSSDIMFQNNLLTDRYVYSNAKLPINGYYYYNITDDSTTNFNNWNLYTPAISNDEPYSKQRVIDNFVVGYGSEYTFRLSVTPHGYPATPDIIVSVNGVEVKSAYRQTNGYTLSLINNSVCVNLQSYLTVLLSTTQLQPPVVQVDTYTWGLLDPAKPGYFEIPQQLEANPTQQEITEISASNLNNQFTSIIRNQAGFAGTAFGGPNNYRDSNKNRSLGSFILQNVTPLVKTMLISSDADLDIITGIRFSQDEYTKFKNKYLRTAQQLINQEFNPLQYHNNTIIVSAWVDEIIKTVNISKEFSSAFAYSYMIANGSPIASESATVPVGGLVTLTNYIDLSDPRNALYVYDTTGQETLLMIGVDYEIVSANLAIDIQFKSAFVGRSMYIAFYKNPLPAYIPSTPTKVGSYGTYIPRIELDNSYSIPANVIIGHDGSKTIAYNDYRDNLLLELEKRIYNLLEYRFRNEYYNPLPIQEVKSGYFRTTRYTREEYLDITESYLNKWSAKNLANYRLNDWATASADLPINSPELWKLYNYSTAVTVSGTELNLPGNWKGIFQFYYDTIYPDTRPWEMLGFTSMPSWWIEEYGAPAFNNPPNPQLSWPNSTTYTHMWSDLEAGIIRQGPSAIFDPVTLQPQPQPMWARPGMIANNLIPVSVYGNIIPVPLLFNIQVSGNLYAPFDGFDNPWTYGDCGPVEAAWMSTSGYAFSVQEFLYLMRPAAFGELFFDTVGTTLSQGMITVPGVYGPVMSNTNWQYVQNETYTSADPLVAWMRPKNSSQYVHAEIVDSVIQIRYGYQRWISDHILFLGKNIATTFGQKVRTLNVNLANKLAGFTNKDTTTTYIESVSTNATTTSLLVPTNNFDVILHKGQPIKTYSYSGVIVRALGDGTFVLYGYDLLNASFKVLPRSNAQAIDVTIGGTPAEFKTYSTGETYNPGDIIRYNGVYYLSLGTIVAGKFNAANWQKLKTLPITGGASVTYRPISEVTPYNVPYGSVFKTVQEVFDVIIGWGAYLETQGWQFTDVSPDTNQISDWLYCAKQFLFWLNTDWAPDASIQLSPAANNAMLIVERGYPNDVEIISNSVYSILDKYGVAIPPNSTSIDRDGLSISVSPTDLSVGGIYFLQVSAAETEHILIFDNNTSFSDVIYDPLLRERQQRLRFNGFRSNAWYGKKEAPGYLIIDNQLVPNFDTIVDDMRYYYDPDTTIDNPSIEALGRHLIGYESKSYLDNLQLSNDVQYLFYQGAIRQKGTVQAFDKLFRSTKVQGDETIEVFEEWALKLSNFGNTVEQVSTEFILQPEQNSGEVVIARLNFIPSTVGFVKQVIIVNAENRYTIVPRIVISEPDWTISGARIAKAYAILNSAGAISRIDISDQGYGYSTAPGVTIESGSQLHHLDSLYAIWQGEIVRDLALDNIVEIDIDNAAMWTVRPPDPTYSLEFPLTDKIDYITPNAGYANFNDVDWTSFNVAQTYAKWGSSFLNPVNGNTVWVAKTYIEDWDIYKMVNITAPSTPNQWKVVQNTSGNLLLLTSKTVTSPISVIPQSDALVTAKLVDGYVSSAQVTLGGSGYSNTNISTAKQWTASTGVTTADVLISGTNIYSVIVAGTTGTTAPTGTSGNETNGTATLHYTGSTLSIATVTIAPPISGSTATAIATVSNGSVISITITYGGSGYTSVPTITISDPVTGITAQATAGMLASVAIDTIVNRGGFFSTAPSVTIVGANATQSIATAATPVNGALSTITATPGSGYSAIPSVVIGYANPVVPAVLEPIIDSSGNLTGVNIINGGSGYTLDARIVPLRASGVTTSPAIITIATIDSTGKILTVNVTPGAGYSALLGELIVPQLSTVPGYQTDFGNTICLQTNIPATATTTAMLAENHVVQIVPGVDADPSNPWQYPSTYVDADLKEWYSYDIENLDGTTIAATDLVGYASLTDLLLFKVMRFRIATGIATAAGGAVTDIQITDGGSSYAVAPLVTITGNGTGAIATATITNGSVTSIVITNAGAGYTTAAVTFTAPVPNYVSLNDKVWIDNINNQWSVGKYNGSSYTPFRVQEKLIETSLFDSAQVYETRTQNELVMLPIYDPFKGILPAPAKQNITYILLQDPARYNVTGDSRLFSNTIIFGEQQVGKIWWDLSTVCYLYYEQPIALDGSETTTDNLVYRRNNWGRVFPGSTFSIYEWTKSPVPPSQYTGTGTPKDITTYVELTTTNRFTNILETNYYFWVLNSTTKPNIENRTLDALDVARLMTSPKSQGFVFFAPIQQTTNNNSYMFYNVQEILSYKGDNVQIQYRLTNSVIPPTKRIPNRDDQTHTQWKFFREGDKNSLVTDQYWDKMVDSLTGYTKILPASEEWSNSIFVGKDLPWDIYGWDIAPYDDATDTTHAVYGEILPVPDPALGESEKYGIEYRPLQGMFINLPAARKVFVQSGNALLKHIPIRDNNPAWNTNVDTSIYWAYTDWYEIGFENAKPTIVFATLLEAQVALTAGKLSTGSIVEILNGTVDGRFVMYNVVQINTIQSFNRIAIGSSAIKLLDTIYTVTNVYNLSVELRQLLNAMRTTVFINNFIVDQNEVYFSMLNYVFSEQRSPNWAFKSSYIYVKENNILLAQPALYMPDQINNIVSYITDSKPYHTQIRDYTSVYITTDIANGTPSSDFVVNVRTRLPVRLVNDIPEPMVLPAPASVTSAISAAIIDPLLIIYGAGNWDANDADPTLDLPWDCDGIEPGAVVGHWDVGSVSYIDITVNYTEHLRVGNTANTSLLLRNGDITQPLSLSTDPDPHISIWNAIDTAPNPATEMLPAEYTSITAASPGGIWYAGTLISIYLEEATTPPLP